MSEKKIIISSLLVLSLAFFLLASSLASAQQAPKPPATVWKVSTNLPPKFWHMKALNWLAEEVFKKTGGKLKLETYPSGALPFRQAEALVTVDKGLVEMQHIFGTAVAGMERSLELLGLPGIVPAKDRAVIVKVCHELFPHYKKLIESRHNIYLYSIVMQGPRCLYMKSPVKTLTDLKGLKIRGIGSMEAGLTKEMDATPISINVGELYVSLQQGLVDGTWFADPPLINFRFYEVVKYIINIRLSESPTFTAINKAAFDKLPKDIQKVITDMQPAFQNKVDELMIEALTQARNELLDKGMIVIDLPDSDMKILDKLFAATQEAYYQKADEPTKQLYKEARDIIEKACY